MNESVGRFCAGRRWQEATHRLKGVSYISINCEGQPLLDTHGNAVGAIAGSDFVDSISDVNSYEKVELTLYFANEEKDGLVAEKREVFHSMNVAGTPGSGAAAGRFPEWQAFSDAEKYKGIKRITDR